MAEVEIKTVPPLRLLALEHTGTIAGVSAAFGSLYSQAIAAGAPVGGPPLTVYPGSPRAFDAREVTFSVCLPLEGELPALPEGLNVLELPEVQAAAVLHVGPYEAIGPAYDELLAWCESEGYSVVTPVREVYLVGPDADGERSPADYRTEIQFPVEKA